jgi:hypothetical protein
MDNFYHRRLVLAKKVIRHKQSSIIRQTHMLENTLRRKIKQWAQRGYSLAEGMIYVKVDNGYIEVSALMSLLPYDQECCDPKLLLKLMRHKYSRT